MNHAFSSTFQTIRVFTIIYNEYKVKSEGEFKQKYIKNQIYNSRALH